MSPNAAESNESPLEALDRAKAQVESDAEVIAFVRSVRSNMREERIVNHWGGRISAAYRRKAAQA